MFYTSFFKEYIFDSTVYYIITWGPKDPSPILVLCVLVCACVCVCVCGGGFMICSVDPDIEELALNLGQRHLIWKLQEIKWKYIFVFCRMITCQVSTVQNPQTQRFDEL